MGVIYNRYSKLSLEKEPTIKTIREIDHALNDVAFSIEHERNVLFYPDQTLSKLYQLAYSISKEDGQTPSSNNAGNNANTASNSSNNNANQNQSVNQSNTQTNNTANADKADEKAKETEKANKGLIKRAIDMIKKIFAKLGEIFKAVLRFFGMGGKSAKEVSDTLKTEDGAEQHLEQAIENTINDEAEGSDGEETIKDIFSDSMSQEDLDDLIRHHVDEYGKLKNKKGLIERTKNFFRRGKEGVIEVKYKMDAAQTNWFVFNDNWSKGVADPTLLKTLMDMSKYYCDFTQKAMDLAAPSHFLANVRKSITDKYAGSNETDLEYKISNQVITELKNLASDNRKYIGPISPKKANKAIDVSKVNSYLSSDKKPMDVFSRDDGLAGIGPLIKEGVEYTKGSGITKAIVISRSEIVSYLDVATEAFKYFEENNKRLSSRDPLSISIGSADSQIDSILSSAGVVEKYRPAAKKVIIRYHTAFVSYLASLEKNLIDMHKEFVNTLNKQIGVLNLSLKVAGLGNDRETKIGRFKGDHSIKTSKDVKKQVKSEYGLKGDGKINWNKK